MQTISLFFVGTAGSGKSTLCAAFARWLDDVGVPHAEVNLDPGAEGLPYEPEVDVREWITTSAVMAESGLGPNGAQVAAADLLAANAETVAVALEGLEPPFRLFDTPGQIELFAFRASSPLLVDCLGGAGSALVYLHDPMLSRSPTGFVSQSLLALTCHTRFAVPMIGLLSKADLLSDVELDRIVLWSEDPYALESDALDERPGMLRNMNVELLRAVSGMGLYRSILPVSATTGTGLEDLYARALDLFTGGEEPDHAFPYEESPEGRDTAPS